jgi:hypothetical protein
MRGDFSRWQFDATDNFCGVLHQQGKVQTDVDHTDSERIAVDWHETAGRDVIGANVAAVPSTDPDSFQVISAKVDNVVGTPTVEIQVRPGRVWGDGVLAHLAGEPPKLTDPIWRAATYFGPPIQSPQASPKAIGDNVRDAVVLELSHEEINAFQLPVPLLEPALGGIDTAERDHIRMAFRLFRLGPGEDCHSIIPSLKDKPDAKGKLTVSLTPTTTIPGDCPVVAGGGYTGFEHALYRIEIARTNSALSAVYFKWSQFNGGLIGRGLFHAGVTPKKVTVTANRTAIVNSGLLNFYLEAVEYDPLLGFWNVTYGAQVTLDAQNELSIVDPPIFGKFPATADDVFFRLWNDIRPVSDFINAVTPVELRDGIHLVFDAPTTANYQPDSYWTFPVRAGEIENPQVLVDAKPPEGVVYHRVPLAEINWTARLNTSITGSIEDCRIHFRPLARLDTCCTFRVGDGITSFGDFDATVYPNVVQHAIDRLPATGGQVCVLPGVFTGNILLESRNHVTITGCGNRSRLISGPSAAGAGVAEPVIHIRGGDTISVDSLALEAHETGLGLLLEGKDPNFGNDQSLPNPLTNVRLEHLTIRAAGRSAVRLLYGRWVMMRECYVEMANVTCLDPAVFLLGDDMLIEHNLIEALVPVAKTAPVLTAPVGTIIPGAASRGGLQIGGTSDRVQIRDNLIRGGAGNGITLGSLIFINSDHQPVPPILWPKPQPVDPCDPQKPATGLIGIIAFPIGNVTVSPASAGSLFEIVIESNRIYQMGMNGIGVVGFFAATNEFISIEGLSILGNDIHGCLRRLIADIPNDMVNSMGYGGISLADVERLVIRDNVIADNGTSHLEPVCGIFVLHVEGMEVSRNRIFNNGAKTSAQANQAKIGRRGGINIVYAVTPIMPVQVGTQIYPGQNGEPALKVHDNVVSAPVGQALSVIALGPISVVSNQFTSRGVVQSGPSAAFFGATIMIGNLGLSNELYLQYLTFSAIAKGSVSSTSLTATSLGKLAPHAGAYLANGNVLFADNQCVLDLFETGVNLSISSIAIGSLDDVDFNGNQCDCSLADDFVIMHAVLSGFSLRASNNRFKESLKHALFSAVTLGFLNTTTNNQSTHCLLAHAFKPEYLIVAANTVLIDPLSKGYCAPYAKVLGSFGHP